MLQESIECPSSLTRVEQAWKVTLQACVTTSLIHYVPHGHFLNTSFVLPQWKSGGICVDMSGMDKIIAIHGVCSSLQSAISPADPRNSALEEDSDLVCQPGIGWMEINEALKEKGIPLFFPVCGKAEGALNPWSSRPFIARSGSHSDCWWHA